MIEVDPPRPPGQIDAFKERRELQRHVLDDAIGERLRFLPQPLFQKAVHGAEIPVVVIHDLLELVLVLPLDPRLVALDLLPMDAIHGVHFIQGDFRQDAVLAELVAALGEQPVDLVLSDMAPNMSGIGVVDQARVMHLAELTLEFCAAHLKPGGDLLVKVFQGEGFMELRKAMQEMFGKVQLRKPAASRDRSAEVYLLARGKRS